MEDFQKKLKKYHKKWKMRLLSKGGQKAGSAYTQRPNFNRGKSAPPGVGALEENEQKQTEQMKYLEELVLEELKAFISEELGRTKLHPANKEDLVNMNSSSKRGKFVEKDVFDMLNKTYREQDKFPDINKSDDLIKRFTNYYLSDIDEDPEPDIGVLYTNYRGSKKASAIVTDGSQKAKEKIIEMMKSFFARPNSWIEVSGAPAHILINKLNMPVIESEEKARRMLPQVTDLIWHGKNPSGLPYGNGWYTREIGGKKQTKIIVGNFK
jgi:hypothetical protein